MVTLKNANQTKDIDCTNANTSHSLEWHLEFFLLKGPVYLWELWGSLHFHGPEIYTVLKECNHIAELIEL